ncbi:MAG: response regulator transcription factor, partial [Eubacterium sp.]
MNYNCLIIDDEKPLAESTAEYFNLFDVSTAAVFDAQSCLDFLTENHADLILLDINLKTSSGFDLCRILRQSTQVPILFISARQSDDDILLALNIGGDDYIRKPYTLSVLLAKVNAVLKRYGSCQSTTFETGQLLVDFEAGRAFMAGEPLKLKAM